jgi:hypothetical protein
MERLTDLIPRIWADALLEDMKRSLETARAFTAYLEQWEIEHEQCMASDPDYARKYEEGHQKWLEEQAQYVESDEEDEDY